MINDINILVTEYTFPAGLKPLERNFFNDDVTPTAGNSIDLRNYLLQSFNLAFAKQITDNKTGVYKRNFESSNITLKLSGIKDSKYLQSFFRIKETSELLERIKYKVIFNYQDETIFIGSIKLQDVQESFKTGDDSDIVTLQIIGFDKEFDDYISNTTLPSPVNWEPELLLPWSREQYKFSMNNSEISSIGWQVGINPKSLAFAVRLQSLFENLLTNAIITDINVHVNQGSAYVAITPQLMKSWWEHGANYKPTWYIPVGYYNFWREGWTICKYLNALLNAMGWVWYFEYTNDGITINITEDYYSSSNVVEISAHNIKIDEDKALNVSFQSDVRQFKHIVIPFGKVDANIFGMFWKEAAYPLTKFSGRDWYKGEKFILLSYDYEDKRDGINVFRQVLKPFSEINMTLDEPDPRRLPGIYTYTMDLVDLYNTYPPEYWGITRKIAQENGKFKFGRTYFSNVGFGYPYQSYVFYMQDLYELNEDDCLFIDSEYPANSLTVCELQTGFNRETSPNEMLGTSEYDFMFTANPAGSLFNGYTGVWNTGSPLNAFVNETLFPSYVMLWKNYRQHFFNYNKKIIDIDLMGVYTDNFSDIRFTQSTDNFLTGSTWKVLSKNIDPINDNTNVKLMRN